MAELLQWREVEGADSYRLQIFTGCTCLGELVLTTVVAVGSELTSDSSGLLTYEVADGLLNNLSPYSWRVQALGAGENCDSAFSDCSLIRGQLCGFQLSCPPGYDSGDGTGGGSGSDSGCLELAVPEILTFTSIDGAVLQLSWTQVVGNQGYNIYRDDALIGSVGVNATSYLDTTAALNVSAEYVVEALNEEGCDNSMSAPASGMLCPDITLRSLDDFTFGETYGDVVVADGGTGPYEYEILSGELPDGVTLNSDGTFSGAPV